MHATAAEFSQEMMQIKWGLKSLDMDRSNLSKGEK